MPSDCSPISGERKTFQFIQQLRLQPPTTSTLWSSWIPALRRKLSEIVNGPMVPTKEIAQEEPSQDFEVLSLEPLVLSPLLYPVELSLRPSSRCQNFSSTDATPTELGRSSLTSALVRLADVKRYSTTIWNRDFGGLIQRPSRPTSRYVVCIMQKRSNTLNWQIPMLSNNQCWCQFLLDLGFFFFVSLLSSPLGSTYSDVPG